MKYILYFFLIVVSVSAKSQTISDSKISNLRVSDKSLSVFDSLLVDKNEIYKFHVDKNTAFQTSDLLLRDSNNYKQQSYLPPSVQNLTITKSKGLRVDRKIIKRDLLLRDTDAKPKLIFPKDSLE